MSRKSINEKILEEDPSFLAHLEALRSVLLRICGVYFLFCLPCWFLAPFLLAKLLSFAAPEGFRLHYFSLMEPFFVQLKLTLLLALFFSLPYGIGKIWGFILPALHEEEKKKIVFPVLSVLFFALLGIAVALFLIIPAMVRFSLSFAGESMQAVLGIGDFVSLLLALILAAMLLFQFPLVIYFLLSLGILNVETIRKKRPHAVVMIFVFAALFSPPDVASQLFLALPAWALFELSLLVFSAKFKEKDEEKNTPRQEGTSSP
ncbi:MAG: twin-arginine translocase subunit TatC [Lentisphaeria bacterium]|nr:twin-arginine translocase subunit TatC [Lentisphaeria bacterium]